METNQNQSRPVPPSLNLNPTEAKISTLSEIFALPLHHNQTPQFICINDPCYYIVHLFLYQSVCVDYGSYKPFPPANAQFAVDFEALESEGYCVAVYSALGFFGTAGYPID